MRGTFVPRHVHHAFKSGRYTPVRLSKLFVPTVPADALAAGDTLESVRRLLRGGYVRQSASGTYSYLPIGMRMLKKVTHIIEEEMDAVDASQVEMPQLLSPALWHKTGRFEAMGHELYRLKDRRGSDMILAPTHEEEVTKLVGMEIESAKSLPVRVYQIGRKFRDEPRPRAGLLRTKEFLMKDLYSFDLSVQEAQATYEEVRQAYGRVFERIFHWDHISEPTWMQANADSGAMGGTFSHEFHVLDPAGEDTLLACDDCTYASNVECAVSHDSIQHDRDVQAGDTCHACGSGQLHEHRAIEVGHTFLLGTRYSEALGYGVVPPQQQNREPLQMGCYGIGVTRILGALAQRAAREFDLQQVPDGKRRAGFVWPNELAPFHALVLPSTPRHMEAAQRLCLQLDQGLSLDGEACQIPLWDVALDDRTDKSLGSRLFDADLLGSPWVFVLGKHFEKERKVEVRRVGHPVQYITY